MALEIAAVEKKRATCYQWVSVCVCLPYLLACMHSRIHSTAACMAVWYYLKGYILVSKNNLYCTRPSNSTALYFKYSLLVFSYLYGINLYVDLSK